MGKMAKGISIQKKLEGLYCRWPSFTTEPKNIYESKYFWMFVDIIALHFQKLNAYLVKK